MSRQIIYTNAFKLNVGGSRTPIRIRKGVQYAFPDELWELIKEYAGIYDIAIEWEVPLTRLVKAMKICCSIRFTLRGYKLEERKKYVIQTFWKMTKQNKFNKKELLTNMSAELKPTKIERWSPPDNLKLGDEILFYDKVSSWKKEMRCGVIDKIGKNSISVRVYIYLETEDPEICRNQTYGYKYLKWIKGITNKTVVIKSKSFYTKADNIMLDYFTVAKVSVDYGN